VQELIKAGHKMTCLTEKEIESKMQMTRMLLVNENCTHLNIFKLMGPGLENCINLLNLALGNCPKLLHLRSPSPFLPSHNNVERIEGIFLMDQKWKNIVTLDLFGFTIFDDAMELICKKMQRLR